MRMRSGVTHLLSAQDTSTGIALPAADAKPADPRMDP